MENIDAGILKAAIALLTLVVTWYVWSLKQKFASKRDLDDLKKQYDSKLKDLELKFTKQNENIIEIKSNMRHLVETLNEIKDYLFSRRKK